MSTTSSWNASTSADAVGAHEFFTTSINTTSGSGSNGVGGGEKSLLSTNQSTESFTGSNDYYDDYYYGEDFNFTNHLHNDPFYNDTGEERNLQRRWLREPPEEVDHHNNHAIMYLGGGCLLAMCASNFIFILLYLRVKRVLVIERKKAIPRNIARRNSI